MRLRELVIGDWEGTRSAGEGELPGGCGERVAAVGSVVAPAAPGLVHTPHIGGWRRESGQGGASSHSSAVASPESSVSSSGLFASSSVLSASSSVLSGSSVGLPGWLGPTGRPVVSNMSGAISVTQST